MAAITKLTTPLQGKLRYADELNTKVGEVIDQLNNISDGDDMTIPGNLTVTGTTTLNGALVLGDAAADSLTVNATTTYAEVVNYSNATSITAYAGGGQANAVALTEELNNVTTVATAGDSVKLPAAVAGAHVYVKNSGATALDIFPASNDSIDALAVNLAVRIMPGSSINFYAINGTVWESDKDQSLSLIAPTTNTGRLELKAAASAANYVTTVTNASQAADRTYTIPDAGANAEFIMSAGNQSIGGTKVFTGTIFGDTIAERTTAAGVTVDGTLIKDGGLSLAGTSATAGTLYSGTISVSGAGTPQTLNTLVGTVTMTGVSDMAADATTSVVINNSLVTTSTIGLVALQSTTAAAGSTPRIESVTYGSGTITIALRNSDPATATGASTYTFSFILFKL